MRVLLTGASGFIGRALAPALRAAGHDVVAWSRAADPGRRFAVLDGCDAVVNLAGEPILAGRWTDARRERIRDSRVALTADLVRAWAALRRRPSVLVSGSAVGVYGDRGDTWLTEHSTIAGDFLAQVCADWERAALGAVPLGARVVVLRTGVVLGGDGGALAQMLPPFRLGAGGRIGSGRQFLPWIHRDDLVRFIVTALGDRSLCGAVNAVAPAPVTSREFAAALGAALHRPAVLPVPAFVLRAIFGDAASVLLGSQRVDPAALRERGFTWRFDDVRSALEAIVSHREMT